MDLSHKYERVVGAMIRIYRLLFRWLIERSLPVVIAIVMVADAIRIKLKPRLTQHSSCFRPGFHDPRPFFNRVHSRCAHL